MRIEQPRLSPQQRRRPRRSRQLSGLLPIACLSLASLSGCQSVSGTSDSSQVRIIDVSPGSPNLDIYQGSGAIAYNLGFGNVTSYIPMRPGTFDFTASASGTRQPLSTARATFAATAQYTVLLGDVSADLLQIILKDQSSPAPAGQIALRFLDQATAVGPVDVYLVPAGSVITAVSPTLTNQTPGSNSGYLNVPAGPFKLVVYPTGSVPTDTSVPAYTGTAVTYNPGAARTIILLDAKLVNTPAVQVITASDYDSPSAAS